MKYAIILTLAILAFACKKEDPAPAPINPVPSTPACQQPTGIKDHTWTPGNTALATLRFRSDGKYFQNTDSSGAWSFKGCDSVYVTRPSNNFYYRVKALAADSVILVNPSLGEVTYKK